MSSCTGIWSVDSINYGYDFGPTTTASYACGQEESPATNKISCNSSTWGSYYYSWSTSYAFGSVSSETVSSCTMNNFECNSSNAGKTHVWCNDKSTYSFNESSASATTCSTTTSFTCDSSKTGSSYVSKCTPASYSCASGYTKLNDSWCYK